MHSSELRTNDLKGTAAEPEDTLSGEQVLSEPEATKHYDRTLAWLLVLFVASGAAALIYEVIWFQLLQLVIGSSSLSLAVLLATFMGGMCIGSMSLPYLVPRSWHPLRVYAVLEAAIGLWALGLIEWLPQLDRWYSLWAGQANHGAFGRAVLATICLVPPTIFMGATLPAIARYVEQKPSGVTWLGFFYGGNIVGAVLGCLAAGFFLLRLYDMPTASSFGMAINGAAAALAMVLSWRPGGWRRVAPTHSGGRQPVRPSCPWDIALGIAVSGCAALGAEVVWTRLLSLTLGGTVYAFSIILAVFLAGLGLGSTVASRWADRASARLRFALVQLALVAAIAWAHYQLTASIPYWPIEPGLTRSPWDKFQLDIVRCLWAVFPAACCWGAAFPLALLVAMSSAIGYHRQTNTLPHPQEPDSGRVVGIVYAANTFGAIFGSLAFSLIIIPRWGTQRSGQILVMLALTSAGLVWVQRWISGTSAENPLRRSLRFVFEMLCATIALVITGWLVFKLPATPPELIAYGRFLPRDYGWAEVVYAAEGTDASVAVSVLEDGTRNFHISGKVEASSEPMDMRLQRMLGHIPALLHPAPRSVLVVGCGAGVTAGTFLRNV